MVVLSLLTSLVAPYPFPMKLNTPHKIVGLLAPLALLVALMVLLLALPNMPFVACISCIAVVVVLSLPTSLVDPYPFPMKFSTPHKIVRRLALLALLLVLMVLLLALQNIPFVAYVSHALQL